MEATQVSVSPTSDGLQRAVWILVAGYAKLEGANPPKI